jgi:hypothetical protein
MLNPIYHFDQMREVLAEFEPSRELSLAKTKLEECEMWLAKCRPTQEALHRDLKAPEPNKITPDRREELLREYAPPKPSGD